jgi:hypothetical protein
MVFRLQRVSTYGTSLPLRLIRRSSPADNLAVLEVPRELSSICDAT